MLNTSLFFGSFRLSHYCYPHPSCSKQWVYHTIHLIQIRNLYMVKKKTKSQYQTQPIMVNIYILVKPPPLQE